MKIVFISDTHSQHEKLDMPEGDLLIHSGDFSIKSNLGELINFNEWLGKLSFRYKIVVAGNHDYIFGKNLDLAKSILTNAIYLENSIVDIEGLKIYGLPVTPTFYKWSLYKSRPDSFNRAWESFPNNVDIIVTHNPPFEILDKSFLNESCGCKDLLDKVMKIKPKIHCFGHIHEGYGMVEKNGIIFINSSSLDRCSEYLNRPIVLEI